MAIRRPAVAYTINRGSLHGGGDPRAMMDEVVDRWRMKMNELMAYPELEWELRDPFVHVRSSARRFQRLASAGRYSVQGLHLALVAGALSPRSTTG